jgi:hypothetical protein
MFLRSTARTRVQLPRVLIVSKYSITANVEHGDDVLIQERHGRIVCGSIGWKSWLWWLGDGV